VGNAAIQYTVQDEQGLSSDGVVNVTITSENDAPVISGSPVTSVLQGQLYDFTPVVTDIDTGDAKVFTITNMPDWAAFDTATGRLHGTPNNSHVGEHSA
ncbi:Ig-like domain-containing protein, partial [Pseudoalteromonas piscicida]